MSDLYGELMAAVPDRTNIDATEVARRAGAIAQILAALSALGGFPAAESFEAALRVALAIAGADADLTDDQIAGLFDRTRDFIAGQVERLREEGADAGGR